MYEIRVASLTDFERSHAQWSVLVHSMARPSIFCSWEWIHTWWKHFGTDYSLRILFVYEDGNLTGILPLALRYMRPEDCLVPVRVLSFCGTYELSPDHMDFIHDEVHAQRGLAAIVDFLSTDFRDWDVLHFSHVADESHLMKLFKSNESRFRNEVRPVSIAPYIDLTIGKDNYLQQFSRKHRYNLKRQSKRLLQDFGMTIDSLKNRAWQDSELAFRELFELHKLRKYKKGIQSSFTKGESIKFHVDLATMAEMSNWIRLYSLRQVEQAVAAHYGFVFGKRFYFYQSGLHPDWERDSAGTTLLFEVINEAFDTGLQEFDFLRGDEAYKRAWTSKARTLYDIWVYNTTTRSVLFRQSNLLRREAKTLFKKICSRVVGSC